MAVAISETQKLGKITQVIGPVVDVEFPPGALPEIFTALLLSNPSISDQADNLTIEVGSMLITGRRCALLKDVSIKKMPTDLVGQIYKAVDLTDPKQVGTAIHGWLRDDLNLGACQACKSA